ncbi:MAG: zinc-ribbon domain-containing protein [Lachnospiraceae bacterium]|nr:zinc-ribbon domain-containing protein [Lachnospiraceae bacterium]
MAFLDDWSRKIGHMGQSTIQKTKDAAGVARINSQIYEEEKKINNLYLEIGKRYVSLHAEDYEEAMEDPMQDVRAAFARIQEYREQIRQIKGVKLCEKCGAEIQEGALFCSNCGNRIVRPEKDGADRCVKCGAALQPGTLFCTNCGTPVKEMKEQEEAAAEEPKWSPEGMFAEDAAEDPEESFAKEPSESPEEEAAQEKFGGSEEGFAKEPSESPEEEAVQEEFGSPAKPYAEPSAEEPAVKSVETPSASVCPQCGAAVREGMNFCTNCGHRMKS